MQYPYLTLLEIITVLLTLLIGIVIFYFLVKRWQKIKFLTVLKTVFLYELGSLFIYLIYPFPLLSRISNVSVLKILDVLIFGIILFFVFYFITKKILLINWKKTLILFLLVIIILFPFLDYFRTMLVEKIKTFSVFVEERSEIEKYYGIFSPYFSFDFNTPEILFFRLITKIKEATLSWPSYRFRKIMIEIQIR